MGNNRRGRMTPIQLQMLVDIIHENPELISSKFTSSSSREERNNKWQSVASLLNSKALGPHKTADQWRKSWADVKCAVRSKAAKIELAGGTDLLNEKLTNLDKRILQLTGDIAPSASPAENENKKLTNKQLMNKLEVDLFQSEVDLNRILMKKGKELVLPSSVTKIVEMPEANAFEIKEGAEENDANDSSNDGSVDDINYDDIEIYEETLEDNVQESEDPPIKRRRISFEDKVPSVSNESKSFISVFQKQVEAQTEVLKEQTSIMNDIAKSLRLIANALHGSDR